MAAEDRMNLGELIEKLGEVTPHLEQRAADIVGRSTMFTIHPGETALGVVKKGGHAFVLGAGILDFLCWAFDEPDKGYVPTPEMLRDPR